MKSIKLLLIGMMSFLLTACINTINIKPDITKIEPYTQSGERLPLHVGYYIPETTVATPHIDENKLRYFAYRDMEIAYQKMLSNVFKSATKLTSIQDASSSAVDLLIVPSVTTKTEGSDALTWPPTRFTVNLTSNIQSADGKPITTMIVTGIGTAGSAERLKITGIAGSRAMEDALLKMQSALSSYRYSGETLKPAQSTLATPVITKKDETSPTLAPSSSAATVSERLQLLNELKAKGLISQKEYDDKRKAIIDAL